MEVGCVTRAEHYPASPGEALRTVTPPPGSQCGLGAQHKGTTVTAGQSQLTGPLFPGCVSPQVLQTA